MLPAFLPFQSPEVSPMAAEAMRGPSIGSLKYRLGLLTSHFRANFPLKACPECIAQDRVRYHTAYWHRSHQLPGAWVCLEHGQLLLECTLKSTGAQRFGWILPDESHFRPVSLKLSKGVLHQLNQLSIAANALASTPNGWHFNSTKISNALRVRLQQNGLASASFRLKTQDIGQAFHAFISPIRILDEFHAVAMSHASATAQACGYFYRLQRVTHPLRHLLMLIWLYQDWATFIEDYQAHAKTDACVQEGSTLKALRTERSRPSVNMSLRSACVELSTERQLSATSIAAHLGVTVATVMAHLSSSGIQTPKRPKLLRGAILDELKSALREGVSKEEASHRFGISTGTVTRFLLSEVGLHQQWTKQRYALNQQLMRDRWTALLSGNQDANLKLLRSIAPDAYAWLYRNDREWLRATNHSRRSRPYNGGRSANWIVRDQKMFALTQLALEELWNRNPKKHIQICDLLQLAPLLKPFINKLDALPLTQSLLNKYIHRRNRTREFRPHIS